MTKNLRLIIFLLAYFLVCLQLTFAYDGPPRRILIHSTVGVQNAANEIEVKKPVHKIEEDGNSANSDEEAKSEEAYSIMGDPLSIRRFFISIRSAKPLIATGITAFSALGWFFGTVGTMKKNFLNFINVHPPKVPDILFKLKIIELKLNQNYENAVNFKNSITNRYPEAEPVILISQRGFYCDAQFCELTGMRLYGMGICTPYYCDCSKSTPKAKRCHNLYEVFDPVYRSCDEAYRVKTCGF